MGEEKKTLCPICNKGLKLKKDGKGEPHYIYCEEYKPEKTTGNEFVNKGKCDFKIFFDQKKAFNLVLSQNDMKRLLAGGEITNAKGDTMTLDKTNEKFFTHIDYKEDEDF